MIRIKILVIISFLSVFVFSNSALSCSCYGPDYFDLLLYDSNKYIFEVTVKSRYEPNIDSLKQDTLSPLSLYEFNLLNGYYISVNEVYKGDVDLLIKHMGFPNRSSCSWTPQIGYTYIFYTDWIDDIEMCHRKVVLEYDQEEFETEKRILKVLKENPDTISIRIGNKMLIQGKNENGIRAGTWLIYSLKESNEIAFELDYEDGSLKKIRTGPGYIEDDHWQFLVNRRYQELILENKN